MIDFGLGGMMLRLLRCKGFKGLSSGTRYLCYHLKSPNMRDIDLETVKK